MKDKILFLGSVRRGYAKKIHFMYMNYMILTSNKARDEYFRVAK